MWNVGERWTNQWDKYHLKVMLSHSISSSHINWLIYHQILVTIVGSRKNDTTIAATFDWAAK